MRRLVKQYMPKGAKKEEHEIEGQFTYARAYRYFITAFVFEKKVVYSKIALFRALLDELGDQAGQHEVVAENLSSQVAAELGQLVRQLKEDRRKV